MVILFSITTGILLSGKTYAQKDSIRLEPVIVQGFVPVKFMSGLKVQKFDSTTLSQFKFRNISDLLSLYTPIAFKNYGPGQLNTASFRGTSSNHTAVLWNGLNINSPSLGQTDFSTIPVAGFDQLSVQYGSAASIVGTDAVGGSILLGSSPVNAGFNASVGHQHESFDNYQSQVSANYGVKLNDIWKISGKTNAYYGMTNNHFPYSQRRGYSILPSETFQKGLVQDLFLQSKNDQELSAHIWLTNNKLTIAPNELAGRELTLTEAYRTMLRYRFKDLALRTSWVRDIIDYAKSDFKNPDHAVTDKFSNRIEKDFQWNIGTNGNAVQVKAGAEWTHFRAKLSGYKNPLITENRGDLFLLTRFQVTQRVLLSLNLRQALITRFNPPVTPSFGGEYILIQKHFYHLKLKGSIARSYRVPTLNERYWKELGNPEIRPESGWNREIGLDQTYQITANQHLTTSITGYYNRIKDWTYWNPARNYRVENLKQVLAKGIEFQLGWKSNYGVLRSGANLGYAFNNSTQEKSYDAYSAEIVGKQLVFVPMHSGNGNVYVLYKKWKVTGQLQAFSKRYSTFDNSQFLPGYTLVNMLTETTLNLNRIRLLIQGRVDNLANTFYLNVRNNAMPGRSFALSLVVNYRSTKNNFY
ncbi:TonB-dependent siderophore receptor [Dyadobacter sp. CY323]|uniref:TonB-dependent receptor plug domain-containing protein n=1 Tax=Dyadobacter sp. CY323 TaxID=2907302 RepID=UPI001F2AADCD|nr:TonB-dependent receptor plug domain-containing protein [Dyadobacter sp. CY323]MCE6990588.1 TonB-dependent receptor [Dyadobacter sp. CY323]